MADVKQEDKKIIDINENREKKVEAFKGQSNKKLNQNVKRSEVLDVIKQIIDRINETNTLLMEDVNTLYAKHVFPFQLRMDVLESLLIKKGILTEEEVKEGYNEKIKVLQEQARAIKQKDDGSEELATKEESELMEKEQVVKAMQDKEDK